MMNEFIEIDFLSQDEIRRYQRQLNLKKIGLKGQEKIKQASVLIIGLGGLGSPVGQYLAAVGVGHLGLVDHDHVNISNLHRQVIHFTSDCDRLKVDSAKEKISQLNPYVEIEQFPYKIDINTIEDTIRNYEYIIDCTDNFQSRYIISDSCFLNKKTYIYAAINQFEGYVSVFDFKNNMPCYRCFQPNIPPADVAPNCAEAGVLGVLPGIIGSIQANEVLKLILENKSSLTSYLFYFNALNLETKKYKIQKNENCVLCSPVHQERDKLNLNATQPQTEREMIEQLEPQEYQNWQNTNKEHLLIDVREDFELRLADIQGKNIPLARLSYDIEEIEDYKNVPVVILCHHGMRSISACQILKSHGFTKLYNLKGGIDRWSLEINPDIPRY